MKKQLTLLLACLPFFLVEQVDTTIFDWQAVPLPPVPVKQFARSGDRLFAGSDYGLYFSDDQGVTWERHPDFKAVLNVAADEQGVIVEGKQQGFQNPPYGQSAWYLLYRSGDGGNTFEPPIPVDASTSFHYGNSDASRVLKISDNTLCYTSYSIGLLAGPGKLNYTHDGGDTWQTYSFDLKGGRCDVFAAQDTAVLRCQCPRLPHSFSKYSTLYYGVILTHDTLLFNCTTRRSWAAC